jgi:cytochrome c-type biogenesis protein CcmH/NrfG
MRSELWGSERYDTEAHRLYERGEHDAAAQLLEEGLSLYPTSTQLLVSLGYVRLAQEEYGWARRSFEVALVLEPEHEEALAGLGEALLKLGERARAFLLFDRVLALGFGNDADLMVCVGRALFREGLYERAERFFRLAVKADPDAAEALLELAFTLYKQGDVNGALGWSRRAAKGEPPHFGARVFYGNLLFEKERYGKALAVLAAVPTAEMWDAVAVWRVVELFRRLRGLAPDSERVRPYMERLELLTAEPTPEERLLAEIESAGHAEAGLRRRGQLDLFGWTPPPDTEWERDVVHRVRVADGQVFEGDWTTIVRAMRDGSADPSVSLREFMRHAAQSLADRTGIQVSWDDPRRFIEDFARAGALRIES